MIKIAVVVRDIVNNDPTIAPLLGRGFINTTSYAHCIRSQVEEILMREVKVGTIVVALRRLADELSNAHSGRSRREVTLSPTELVLRPHLTEITFANTRETLLKFNRTVNGSAPEDIVSFTKASSEIALVIHTKAIDPFLKALDSAVISIRKHIWGITLILPIENVLLQGIYMDVLQKLSWRGINIIDIVSTQSECTVLVDESDAHSAMNVLGNATFKGYR